MDEGINIEEIYRLTKIIDKNREKRMSEGMSRRFDKAQEIDSLGMRVTHQPKSAPVADKSAENEVKAAIERKHTWQCTFCWKESKGVPVDCCEDGRKWDAAMRGETIKPASALDTQIAGDHYQKLGAYQPWSVLKAWLTPEEFRGYMKGTAIAYLAREKDKGGMVDIEKAAHTLQGLVELAK